VRIGIIVLWRMVDKAVIRLPLSLYKVTRMSKSSPQKSTKSSRFVWRLNLQILIIVTSANYFNMFHMNIDLASALSR